MASGSIPLRKPLNLDSLVFQIKINLAPFAVAIYPIPVGCGGISIFCLLQLFKMQVLFCKAFLEKHPMICINGTFFTVNGRVTDENKLKKRFCML